VTRFFRGRHALIPFPRPEDIGTVADVAQSFVIDNGAFSIWKQGGELDVEGYVTFCEMWCRHPAFDWALIPDVIQGTEAANNELIDQWPDDITGVPVWHYHESLDRLDWLIRLFPCVALGSSGEWPNPGTDGWWDRTQEVMSTACDSEGRPRTKLHGLRMMAPDLIRQIPLHSADSTNAAQNAGALTRFGCYTPPTQSQRGIAIAERIELAETACVWKPVIRPKYELLGLG
jgi:hypothetical protein